MNANDRRLASLAKVKAKLQAYFNENKFYEAQQLYMSLYNRLSARKQYNDAIDLLQDGIKQLLNHEQTNAGVELSMKLIETYELSNSPCNDNVIDQIINIFNTMDINNKTGRCKFMKAAIKWSGVAVGDISGSPRLNAALARYYTKLNDHAAAQRHWLRSRCPIEHAAQLDQWSRMGLKGERDLFIARAVLQYCCLQNLCDANGVFNEFIRLQKDQWNENSPLVHFIKYLLKTLERDAPPLFRTIVKTYDASIKRDPQFPTFVDKIGLIYYNIQPPKNFLEQMMQSFMGGNN